MASEASTESGIEISTISVDRHEPRNSRIISPVSPAAIAPSRSTSAMAPDTNTDWSNSGVMVTSFGAAALIVGSSDLTAFTTERVDAWPFFSTVSSTPRCPSWRTMFCCGGLPSRTKATSRTRIGDPFTTRTGTWLSVSIASGLEFSRTSYWVAPNFARPDGVVRFCAVIALVTSCGVSP